jgi:hypothetical protein
MLVLKYNTYREFPKPLRSCGLILPGSDVPVAEEEVCHRLVTRFRVCSEDFCVLRRFRQGGQPACSRRAKQQTLTAHPVYCNSPVVQPTLCRPRRFTVRIDGLTDAHARADQWRARECQ